jgi:hypothetical protein
LIFLMMMMKITHCKCWKINMFWHNLLTTLICNSWIITNHKNIIKNYIKLPSSTRCIHFLIILSLIITKSEWIMMTSQHSSTHKISKKSQIFVIHVILKMKTFCRKINFKKIINSFKFLSKIFFFVCINISTEYGV